MRKSLARALAGFMVGCALAAVPVSQLQARTTFSCDTLTCTPTACCTINSETGDICDCHAIE